MMLSSAVLDLIQGSVMTPDRPHYQITGLHGTLLVDASIGEDYLVTELLRLIELQHQRPESLSICWFGREALASGAGFAMTPVVAIVHNGKRVGRAPQAG